MSVAVTPEDIAAVLEALQFAADAETPGRLTKAGIASLTGLPCRTVEATVEAIRRDGIALVASSSAPPPGYWLPRSLAEAEENIKRRHSRAITQMTTCQGERNLIRRLRDADALETWRAVFAVAV
jgi:hypothetical protein